MTKLNKDNRQLNSKTAQNTLAENKGKGRIDIAEKSSNKGRQVSANERMR